MFGTVDTESIWFGEIESVFRLCDRMKSFLFPSLLQRTSASKASGAPSYSRWSSSQPHQVIRSLNSLDILLFRELYVNWPGFVTGQVWKGLGSCLFCPRRWLPPQRSVQFGVRAMWGGKRLENTEVPYSQPSLVSSWWNQFKNDWNWVNLSFFSSTKDDPSCPFYSRKSRVLPRGCAYMHVCLWHMRLCLRVYTPIYQKMH